MRSRKGFNPAGSKEFFEALSKMNVPKDLVRNQQRWKQLLEFKGVGTPQQSFDTPSTSSEGFQSVLKSYTPKQWLIVNFCYLRKMHCYLINELFNVWL